MSVLPLLRLHRPEANFAWRDGSSISAATFLHDVAALANLLPAHRHVVNLCADRYNFTVGFAAALCRSQTNLLPPHDAPELLKQLAEDFPDLYCLTDGSSPAGGLKVFGFPTTLGDSPATAENPVIATEQPACVLFTSGSTGRPRPHARSWGELVGSAVAEGSRLNIPALAGATLLGTVPHQHSYGLESLVMLALQHGLALEAGRLFYPADIRAQIAATPQPRVLVTTPVHLRVLLAEPETPSPVDLVLCATAPLAGQLAREAEARFALSLYEIYGCSEAGQIAARRTALTEEWHCLDGITLRQDAAGTWASGAPIAVETLLPDVIELHDPERFLLHGRIADLVDVAGKRTSLAHLNYHLNAIDGVQDGAFAIADSSEQAVVGRLAAFVVAPGRSADYLLAELRRRIDVAFLPRPLCLVPALPRNALGKLPFDEIQRLIAEARNASVITGPDPVISRGTVPGQMARPAAGNGAAGLGTHDRAGTGTEGLGSGTAAVQFHVGHPTAEGHFPGNPIIPGAVLLREVVAAIATATCRLARSSEVVSAKFHRPVRPGEAMEIRWAATGTTIRFACSTASARTVVTGELRLAAP
jgi:3-hydroxymyristoyl/3-hydroxydecanoyl-(acyl carrier protein) dehydratase